MGDLKEIPGSWLWANAALAVAVIWKVNQQKEDLSFFPLYS